MKLDSLKYEGNYFFFLSEFESTVTELKKLNGVLSWKDIALMFLNRLPAELSVLLNQSRTAVEATEDDLEESWTTAFTTILDYLIDAKLYNPSERQIRNKPKKALNARFKRVVRRADREAERRVSETSLVITARRRDTTNGTVRNGPVIQLTLALVIGERERLRSKWLLRKDDNFTAGCAAGRTKTTTYDEA